MQPETAGHRQLERDTCEYGRRPRAITRDEARHADPQRTNRTTSVSTLRRHVGEVLSGGRRQRATARASSAGPAQTLIATGQAVGRCGRSATTEAGSDSGHNRGAACDSWHSTRWWTQVARAGFSTTGCVVKPAITLCPFGHSPSLWSGRIRSRLPLSKPAGEKAGPPVVGFPSAK